MLINGIEMRKKLKTKEETLMKIKYLKSLLAIAVSGALLYGCSGGSDSSTSTTSTGTTTTTTGSSLLTGTFIDAAVSGLSYSTPSQGNGTTNASGEFNYMSGEKVTFSVGPIKLGSATGQAKMSPLDLLPNLDAESKFVRAMASLLQSLDSDPAAGIQLPSDLSGLAAKLTDAGINPFDFSTASEADIDTLVSVVQDYVSNDDDPDTNFVSLEDAAVQLAAGLLDADIYLMNVSKTPEAYSDKAGITSIASPNGEVNALIMSFEDGTGDNGEPDAWTAMSFDNGLTWSRTNLSRSGGQDIQVSNLTFKVDNGGPSMHVEGNYALVSWISTYCPSANPFTVVDNNNDSTSDILPVLDTTVTDPADPTADLFQVAGSQGIVSYSFGNVPYHCVWTARGVLNDTGRMVWYKPQQLTSGRRDAKLDWPAGREDVAFGVTWQEDPEGLDPGLGEGPGLGWSGATTHHKTDIWYSYIDWANFEATTADSCDIADPTCRPTAAYRLSVPVRVSDNAACKIDKSGDNPGPLYCTATTALVTDGPVYCAEQVEITDVGTFCKSSYKDEDAATVGYPLDGNTAASRPNLHFAAGEGGSAATALLTYEETKGLCREEGTENGCPDEPWAIGKFVIYHHFAYNKPDTVNHGYIISQPATQEQVYDSMIDNIEPVYDWNLCSAIDVDENGTTENGCYENSRRERFVVNSDESHNVKLALIYKQGAFKQGERADIFLRRAVGGFKTSNFTDNVCISCGSETVTDGTVTEVVWNTEDLQDGSTTNIYDDARSLRAQLDRDRLLIGFAWTSDWLKAVTADPDGYYKDQYNFLVRRSFDAGETWDVPRNTSNLVKSKISVVEPRIATIDEDPTQKAWVVTYCTAENKVRIASTDGVPTHAPGLDCFYARTTDDGETYEVEDTDGDGNPDFLCLACGDTEQVEPEVFLTPDGNTMHAAWAQKGDLEDEGSDMHNGSDVWYRQIGITDTTTTTTE